MSSCVSATRIQVQQLPQQVACFCQPRNACDTDATISHSLKRHMRDYLPSFCSLANNHPSFCNQDGDLSVLHCTQFLWPTTASSLFEKFGCVPGLVGLASRTHFRRVALHLTYVEYHVYRLVLQTREPIHREHSENVKRFTYVQDFKVYIYMYA
jgi:hypothetical protein